MKRVLLMAVLFVLSLSVTQAFAWTPLEDPSAGVSLVYVNGLAVAVSRLGRTAVGVAVDGEQGETTFLRVAYRNNSDAPLVAQPESIELRGRGYDGGYVSGMVYDPDSYIESLRTADSLSQAIASLGAALFPSGPPQTSFNMSGPDGFYWGTITDYGAQAQAQQQQQAELQREAVAQAFRLQQLSQAMLRMTTVLPGQAVEGLVVVAAPKTPAISVVIPFGDEVHELQFVR
ncbi:MAG TPA: hypothetical protein GXX28_07815 [Firmicutes bacterium]|nr:hypothetical protein [Bacillota bacterium]